MKIDDIDEVENENDDSDVNFSMYSDEELAAQHKRLYDAKMREIDMKRLNKLNDEKIEKYRSPIPEPFDQRRDSLEEED